MRFRTVFLALASLLVSFPAVAQPPASAFGRLPGVQDAAVSPDGTHVAVLGGPSASRRMLIIPTAGGPQVVTELGATMARDVSWATDDRVLLTFTDLVTVGNQGVVPEEERLRRLRTRTTPADWRTFMMERTLLIDRQGNMTGRVLSNTGAAQFSGSLPIVGRTSGSPPSLMVLGNTLTGDLSPTATRFTPQDGQIVTALWRVNPTDGRGQIVEVGNNDTTAFMVDLTGEARVRIDRDQARNTIAYVRAKGESRWRELTRRGEWVEGGIVGYSDPEDAVYLIRIVSGRPALWRQPLAAGAAAEQVAMAGRDVAVLGAVFDPYLRRPVALVAGSGERNQVRWLDEDLNAVHRSLTASFPGAAVNLASWSRDRSRFVVRVDRSSTPTEWYLFDARTNRAQVLGDAYPELAGAPLGERRWIRYSARDGLTIPAYLTVPQGVRPGSRAPLIVLPHGGPAARDEFGFDWWSQFLAARGYVVLQPQFRGSRGFGEQFERAGDGQWAGAMQDDLLDGIAHLASDGTIDPARVCIAGASFGGYAAMAGAIYHPDAYRCAVSVAGVSDLPAMLGWTSSYTGPGSDSLRYWRRNMGSSTPEVLARSSPARQPATNSSPILLIHGENDTIVPYEQSLILDRALRRAGRPVELVTLQSEDHFLSTAATRTQMLEAMGRFLEQHLPVAPRATETPDAPRSAERRS